MTALLIGYQPAFIRMYKKLPPSLQAEVRDRIQLFVTDPRNTSLRVHKLKGKLKEMWSFSVNYDYRVVFEYKAKESVMLLAVGNHQVYE